MNAWRKNFTLVALSFCLAGCDSSYTSPEARDNNAVDPFPPGESTAPATSGGGQPGIAIDHVDEMTTAS